MVAVKLLRRDVVRVIIPSLGGGGRFKFGDSSRGDGESMTFRRMSSARSRDSSSSVTLVFLVYFFSRIRRTVTVMVKMYVKTRTVAMV